MDITRSNLDAMFQSYSTAFREGLARNFDPAIDFMLRDFPSSAAANFYGWLDSIPGFREWVDERVRNNVSSKKYVVTNRAFESTTAIGRNEILDDTYGVYSPVIQMAGESWMERKRQLAISVLLENPLTYTGTALCGTHTLKQGVTLTNLTTDALSKSSFEAALLAASAWRFANGELIRPRFTHLLVGEKKRAVAHQIVNSENIATTIQNVAATENVGGASEGNPNKGKCQLVVLPELAGDYDDHWYLLACGGAIKPVIRQIREEPAPKMDTDPIRIERDGRVDFLATGRAAAAPSFPWLVYGGRL